MTTEKDISMVETSKVLTEAEQKLVDAHRRRRKSRHAAPRMAIKHVAGKPVNIEPASENKAIHQMALLSAFGTTSLDFLNRCLLELIEAGCRGTQTKPFEEGDVNGAMAAMHGIEPRDEIEAMLAAQMIATHATAMRCMRQLKGSETVSQQDSNGNLAVKLLRTYTAQMEALQRYRGKGQQKMVVEHVHVHPGAQAIVGNVTHPEGGGASEKSKEQPHAKQIPHAPQHTMSSPNPKRQPMPIPGNA